MSDCVPTAMEIYLENTHPGKSYDKNTIMQYLRIERGRKINWDTDGVDFTTMIRVFKEYYEIDAYIPDKELHSDPYDLNLLDTLTKNGSSIFLTTNAPGSRLHTILLRGVRGIGEEKEYWVDDPSKNSSEWISEDDFLNGDIRWLSKKEIVVVPGGP